MGKIIVRAVVLLKLSNRSRILREHEAPPNRSALGCLGVRARRPARQGGRRDGAHGFHRRFEAGIRDGPFSAAANQDLEGIDAAAVARASEVIVIGSVLPEVAKNTSVVLPIANFSEEEGTVTNLRGRVQRFTQAKQAPGDTRPSWLVLGDLLGAMGKQSNFFLPSEVFAGLASSNKAFAGLSYDSIGFRGLPLANGSSTGPSAPIAVGAA